MEALGLNLGYLIVQILNFAVIFVVLRAWVYKPLLGILENRRKVVEKGLGDARVAAEARANAEKEAAKLIDEAQMKANETVREATDRADVAAKGVKAAAEAEVARVREAAKADIEIERNRMLQELRTQVGVLAMAATQKLIGASLDQVRQQVLVDEFFSGIKAGKVVIVDEGVDLKGAEVEVTSALPLSDKEQATIKKDLKVDVGAAFNFKVDPAILGGLIVKVGDRVVDGSISGQLQNLRERL